MTNNTETRKIMFCYTSGHFPSAGFDHSGHKLMDIMAMPELVDACQMAFNILTPKQQQAIGHFLKDALNKAQGL